MVLVSQSELEAVVTDENRARIRELNDELRTKGEGGQIFYSAGVSLCWYLENIGIRNGQ